MILKSILLSCLAMTLTGCVTTDPSEPSYSLINFAPSLKIQLGGSDATVKVTETQTGSGHSITKEIPVDANVSAATSLEAQGVP